MLDRRTFLASSASLGLIAASGCATGAGQGTPQERDAALDATLQAWFDEDLRDNPAFATNLGVDVGELAHLRRSLGEPSLAKAMEERAEAVARHQWLESFGRQGLSPEGRPNYDIADFRWDLAARGARFRFGSAGGRPHPYIVSQLGGAYYSVPDFLDTQHPLRTADDAEAYLARLTDFARILDQETERVLHDAGLGVVAPDFVIDKTLGNLRALHGTAPAETTLVRSIVRRTRENNVAGDWGTRAAGLVGGPIQAALGRQTAAFERLRPRAVHDAGIWRLPEGEAYYAYALTANNTTDLSAEQVHQMGLDQVRELHGRLDGMLRAQGYTQGTVGDRLNAMNAEARFLFPDDDAGREELLAYLNRLMAELAPRLPRMFNRIPQAAVEIRRVPPTIEAGAPGGYYQGASLDGSRPGAYYINLSSTTNWPKHSLPTLTYHEASPGHHFQISLAREAGELPLYRRTQGFSAYNEGWALYAERIADELGVYADDPFGRIGFLQSYLFRAVRLVVDTGLHHKRWSREQAIRYMTENSARPEASAVREIERYSVWPGQATAYKIGQTVIAGLRDEAERRQSGRFDVKAFHDVVLLGGSMPLTVLERRVREWLA